MGRWLLTSFVGQGAMGVVYAAEPTAAIKILNARRAAMQPDLVRRFEVEAQAASRLRSPHVARVFDSGVSEHGHLFIAMELLKGEPLDTVLETMSRLPPAVAVAIGHQLAQALVEAHGLGIVHRDLKPANVFIEPTPAGGRHVRLIDFGIARINSGSVARSRTGTVAGTPAYMSPEQLRGQPDIDGRSDIYSLGVVLYQLLTGDNPFRDSGGLLGTLRRHLEFIPPTIEGIPATLDAAVRCMLLKDRALRPQDMAEVRRLLERTNLMQSLGSSATIPALRRDSTAAMWPFQSHLPVPAYDPDLNGLEQSHTAAVGSERRSILRRGLDALANVLGSSRNNSPADVSEDQYGQAEAGLGLRPAGVDLGPAPSVMPSTPSTIPSEATLELSYTESLVAMLAGSLGAEQMPVGPNAVRLDGIPWLGSGLVVMDCTLLADVSSTLGTEAFESQIEPFVRASSQGCNILVVLAKRPTAGVYSYWHSLLQDSGIRVFCTTEVAIRVSIETNKADEYVRELVGTWSVNPFFASTPVLSALDYYGDGRRIQQLLRVSEKSALILVVAPPKAGLTSFLNRVQEEFVNRQCVTVNCADISLSQGVRDLPRALAEKLGLPSDVEAEALWCTLQTSPHVLLIDNVDSLIEPDGPSIDSLRFLRWFADRPSASIAVIGAHSYIPHKARRLPNDSKNPLWRGGAVMYLRPLSTVETTEYLVKNGYRAGVQFDEQAVVRACHRLSGGHPFLLRQIGMELVERVGPGDSVRMIDVDTAAATLARELDDFLTVLWGSCGPVAARMIQQASTCDILTAHLSAEDRGAVDLLTRVSLVSRSHRGFSVRPDLLRHFVRTTAGIPEIPRTMTLALPSLARVTNRRGLADHQAEAVVDAAISCGIGYRERELLMQDIPANIVTQLPLDRRPVDQLRSDVTHLNRLRASNGVCYVSAWLRNAAKLASGLREQGIFEMYLERLQREKSY